MDRNNLSNERKMIILTTRLSMDSNVVEEIKELAMQKDFNWFEFFKLAIYHKSAVLCWKNINQYIKHSVIPAYLNDMLRYSYICTCEKNKLYQDEIDKVVNYLTKNSIICIPVKGAYLIPKLYEDLGIRYRSDADFLVRYSDVDKLKDALNCYGYVQGEVDSSTHMIRPITRSEQIIWKMMSNIYPFVKISKSDVFTNYQLDFRYALDDTLSKEPINEIIDRYINNGYVDPSHYLIHLCSHFYGEAKYSSTLFDATDMNLIKLCDIREFVLKFTSSSDINKTIDFAKKYGLEKQLYFTMFFLNAIYDDGYEQETMEKLNIFDDSFLNTHGRTTLQNEVSFKKDFWDRIFSCNNKDEIMEDTILYYNIK